eukprot:jgi/Tetstr1/441887/TSEL_030097.t1
MLKRSVATAALHISSISAAAEANHIPTDSRLPLPGRLSSIPITFFSKHAGASGSAAVGSITAAVSAVAILAKRPRDAMQRQEMNEERGPGRGRVRSIPPRGLRSHARYVNHGGMHKWRRVPRKTQWWFNHVDNAMMRDPEP